MITLPRERELVGLCQEFIRRPSFSGQERKLASFVRESMLSFGFDHVEVDYYGNVIGKITFHDQGPRILFEAQMDHVEVADPFEWKYYPFGAFIDHDRIYGRGATDQKGSLAAMLCAAAYLKEDHREDLCGEIIVAASVHQEQFEGVSSRLIEGKYSPDFVVIGEASSLKIERGQRGRAEIELETHGKLAHSSRPSYGVNAAGNMVSLLTMISVLFRPSTDPFLGEGILELTNLLSFPEKSAGTIPEKCRAIFDRRLLVGETEKDVLEQIQEIIDFARKKNPDIQASLSISSAEDRCYTGVPIKGKHFAPAWLFPRDHFFVTKALDGLGNSGLLPLLAEGSGFGTNGSYYGGVKKIPTIAFGPSFESLAHITDEYIETSQLIKGCSGYYGIAREMLGKA